MTEIEEKLRRQAVGYADYDEWSVMGLGVLGCFPGKKSLSPQPQMRPSLLVRHRREPLAGSHPPAA